MRAAALLVLVALLAGCVGQPPAPPPASEPTELPPTPRAPPQPQAPACDPTEPWPCAAWAGSMPRFVTALHLDVEDVSRVSRLRSGFGHDYSRSTDESCRSLKHYFVPRYGVAAEDIEIRSPVAGTLVRIEGEHSGVGDQVWLAPAARPEFRVLLFHVTLDDGLALGSVVASGARLGHHASLQTADDVAVLALTPEGPRFVSYFAAMDDAAFAPFAERGFARDDFEIPRAWRDANPMTCEGEGFVGGDTSRDWVDVPERAAPAS